MPYTLKTLFEDTWLGDKPICSMFPRLYHLSFTRLHFLAYVLASLGTSTLFYFGFHRPLSGRKATNVVALLSLF